MIGAAARRCRRRSIRQSAYQLAHAGIALQINVFMLEAPPEPLDEDVVQCPAPSVHADPDILPFEDVGEDRAGGL